MCDRALRRSQQLHLPGFFFHPSPPPQLAPSGPVTVGERRALCTGMSRACCCCLSLLRPMRPSPSPFAVTHWCVFTLFDFLRSFFVRATSLNGTKQSSVKLKLLVSLELLKRGFYTCMHSYTLPYAIDIVNQRKYTLCRASRVQLKEQGELSA